MYDDKVNILLVDDKPENLLSLEAILAGLGQNLVAARSGPDARGRCARTKLRVTACSS